MARAHVVIGEGTSAAAAYVGMTRGRDHNTAHLVADDVEQARQQWIEVFSRDRADLGPTRARQRAIEDLDRFGPTTPRRPRSSTPDYSRPRPPVAAPDHGIEL